MLNDLRYRLRAVFQRGAMERELDDELRFHIERAAEKHRGEGVAHAEAERRARLEFGGVDRIKDDARDARGVGWLDSLGQDLRYGWRALKARPGFTAGVVLTLGLGVGANASMFGIVDRMLIRAPAYMSSPDRVHRFYGQFGLDGETNVERGMSYRRYLELAEWTGSFDVLAAVANRTVAIGTGDAAREVVAAAMSASTFALFDAEPVLGRFFTAAEDAAPAGEPVVVLSWGFWQSAYGGRSDALGERIRVNDLDATVVGVAPRNFVGITERTAPSLFVPITHVAYARRKDYRTTNSWSWLEVFARRRPGVSVEAASADLTAAYIRSWEAQRSEATYRMRSATEASVVGLAGPLQLGRGPQAEADAKVVAWVMGVAIIVLLIACANVVNLVLARAVQRRREIALRLALGVSRRRLVQQLFTETLLIALLGGTVGLAVAQWGGSVLHATFLREEDIGAVATDPRTLLFTAAITLGLALLTGLAPALQALRSDVAATLKSGMRDSAYRSSGMRTGLLLFQAALSVVLLVGAGLFVKSLANVHALRLGYDTVPIAVVNGNLRGEELDDASLNALADRLAETARTVPGVTSASVVTSVPFWSYEGRGAPIVPGVDSVAQLGGFILQSGSEDYFATMGTRIVRGRGFEAQDRAGGAPVIVVGESMAAALWPGVDPIGRQLTFQGEAGPDGERTELPMMTVIGVAEDLRGRNLADDGDFWYYLPLGQYRETFGSSYPQLFVRVDGAAEDHAEALRSRLQQEMPGAAYVTIMPLATLVDPQARAWEFGATMFVAFGMLALIVAAIGLYSVNAYMMAQRTRELGVRIALGASAGAVVRLIARQGLVFAAGGIVLGGAAALLAARWIQPLLFSESARDPVVYGAVGLMLLLVSVVATLRPALRAARVDPTIALRAE